MSCCLVGLQHNIVLGGCVVVLFLVVVWLYYSVVVPKCGCIVLVGKSFCWKSPTGGDDPVGKTLAVI